VARGLEPLAGSVSELAEPASTLGRLAEETREVAYSLRDLGQTWDDDPERLERIESRLALYRRLAARFHCTPNELVERRAETETKLAALERDEQDLLQLDEPLGEAFEAMIQAAAALSSARRHAAKVFASAIQPRLKPLGMEKSRLTVQIETDEAGTDPTAPPPPEAGLDRVELVFLSNPGETARPLRKIASGGELSRVTLAAKTVLAGIDRVPTLIFDEIDAGVGGRLGSALGKTLAELARHRQVICITHLPQLASYARRQWAIRKQIVRNRTRTTIVPLSEAERIDELAAMLRGESAAEGTRQEALAMLKEARAPAKADPSTRGRASRR
jgi:DNA repair protein RecN (Recombination protein N)